MKLGAGIALWGAGALAMYFADPRSGKRRRARQRDALVHGLHLFGRGLNKALRDAAQRGHGLESELQAELATALRHEPAAPDDVLAARVRSALGHVVSHPGAIDVAADQGRVTLRGTVARSQENRLLRTVAGVHGVRHLDSRLHPPATGTAANLPPRRRRQPPPAQQLARGAAAAGLLLLAARRSGLPRWLAAAGAAGLGLPALTGIPLGELVGRGRPLTLEKSIWIAAPRETLYRFFADPTQYPAVFSHVHSVERIGSNLYRWSVAGPLGTAVAFDGRLTSAQPPDRLAWRSSPRSAIAHSGTMRLAQEANGTRVAIRLLYRPWAGRFGYLAGEALGVGPKSALDDDLVRLKTLFEAGKTTAHGHEVHLTDVRPRAVSQ
ncbi:MAG TPA: SRPBCC family protein [Terriglobales bacterium]|nr:SRPBCC family protein [Terriglobales bacterium]